MNKTVLTVAILAIAGVGVYLVVKHEQEASAAAAQPTTPQQINSWLGAIGSLGNDVASLWGGFGGGGSGSGSSDTGGLSQDEWDFIGGGGY